MRIMLAVVCLLLSILHGAKSAETKHVVEGVTADNQPSLGQGRKLGAVVAGYLSALASDSLVANRGTCTIANRLEAGFARKGEAFRQTVAPDAVKCAHMCKTIVAGCIAINYRNSDRACFFLADPGYIYVSPGFITALVNPSLDNVCNRDNLILGYDRPGGDMPGGVYHCETALECCWKCVTTPDTTCLLKLLAITVSCRVHCVFKEY